MTEQGKAGRDRIFAEIKDPAESPDFYAALDEAINCIALHRADQEHYERSYKELLKLRHFFFLQIYLTEK